MDRHSKNQLCTVEDGPYLKIENFTQAEDAWVKLQEDYQPRGIIALVSAFNELQRCRLENFANVQSFGDKLKLLQAQINRLDPEAKISDTWLKLHFLEGLSPAFEEWITSFHATYDLLHHQKDRRPSFDAIVKKASELEGVTSDQATAYLAAPTSRNGSKGNRPEKTTAQDPPFWCRHCNAMQ